MEFTYRDRVDQRVGACGFDPDDVTHVVESHAHLDHTGGLKLSPRARFFIGEADVRYVFWPHPANVDVCRWIDLEHTKAFRSFPQPGDLDLFVDGSIVMLATPGHTHGLSSLLVRLERQTVTGDTVHLRVGVDAELPMGGDHDTNASVRSIRRLKSLSDSLNAEVWVGHDPGDLVRLGGY